MPYAEIAVNVPGIEATFDYHLPPDFPAEVRPGHLVTVPFGRQKAVQGVVLAVREHSAIAKTRPVTALLDDLPVLTPAQLALAYHLAEDSLTPLSACIRLMLPPGLAQQVETSHALTPQGQALLRSTHFGQLGSVQQDILRLLAARGVLSAHQLARALPQKRWPPAMQGLERRGLVTKTTRLPAPTVRPLVVRMAAWQGDAASDALGKSPAARQRRAAMLEILKQGAQPVGELYARTGGSLADLRYLEKHGLVRLWEEEAWRDPLSGREVIPQAAPPLMPDQDSLWGAIRPQVAAAAQGTSPLPILLHGVTGSGKTEIYLRAVSETLASGRQAVILVPEIALTPQTVQRFLARFPGKVGLVHSKLSQGERFDTWRRARLGEVQVVVGPRSALFAPLPDIGLIVVDESHDDSYYQSEQPTFHARDLAAAYARLNHAVCILGSATPDVGSMYHARRGEWQYLCLPQRILAHAADGRALMTRDLPPVQVVDMRAELKAGNRSIFSRALQSELQATVQRGEQAILFLNRRGTATYVFCRDCGYTLRCPHCETPLTYHQDGHGLHCHHCGYRRGMPRTCPQCKGERIRQYGTGTEKVEAEVHRFLPSARTLRWDQDTTRRKGAHERILAQFAAGEADILIGTQMLAKGLDLPLVTLVGVVLADVGLALPDYRSTERVFQVLTQVAGRAGRSARSGRVVLQTFDPAHYVIRAAAQHDYAAFYEREIAERRRMGYPPFTRMARLEYRHFRLEEAQQTAETMAARLQAVIAAQERRTTALIGPVPCFFGRVNGIYRWQIVVRGPDPQAVLRAVFPLPENWQVQISPVSLL
ncbi:MAG: primosomal protein N' [Anaerolineales bacterium]